MMASGLLPFNLSFNISQRRSLGLSTNSNIAWGALSDYQTCISEFILLDDRNTVVQTFGMILWEQWVLIERKKRGCQCMSLPDAAFFAHSDDLFNTISQQRHSNIKTFSASLAVSWALVLIRSCLDNEVTRFLSDRQNHVKDRNINIL